MGKIISEGLVPPDDPMFSGGLETFSVRNRNRPVVTDTGLSLDGMLDTITSFADDDEERPAGPKEDGDAS
jgi:hypothetical protein